MNESLNYNYNRVTKNDKIIFMRSAHQYLLRSLASLLEQFGPKTISRSQEAEEGISPLQRNCSRRLCLNAISQVSPSLAFPSPTQNIGPLLFTRAPKQFSAYLAS